MKIIVIGNGGHAHACIDILEMLDYEVMDIINASDPILSLDYYIKDLIATCPNILIAFGQLHSPTSRKIIYKRFKEAGACFPAIVSPLAYVSKNAEIGEGTIIMHHVIVNACATVGDNCIINTKALIEHDCIVGNNCHISTGVILNGAVKVNNDCFIGSGTVVKQCVSIAEGKVIGAGNRIMNSVG